MKRFIYKLCLVSIILVLVISFSIQASAETIYNYNGYSYYLLSDTTISICGWDNRSSELTIPKDILDRYVVEISNNAFKDNSTISSVDLTKANMINRIGNYSFMNCTNLSGNVVITYKTETLGMSAFQQCSSLESVAMKTSRINVISDQAFYKCSSLSSVTLPDNLTTIKKLAFADCASLETITIPASVTSIDDSAFRNDTNLTIRCNNNSYAMQFAIDNGIDYDVIDPLLGDVDGSGKVNIRDVTCIQLYGVGRYNLDKHAIKRADVNRNGFATIDDATYIQLYKVGKIKSFDNIS